MNAADALQAALASGVHVAVDGHDLVLEAAAPPPEDVLDALSRYKPAIVALLVGPNNRAPDQREIVQWLDKHPAASPPGRCAWCGTPESPGAVVLPFGTVSGTHAWLHAECWPAWHEWRRAEAIISISRDEM